MRKIFLTGREYSYWKHKYGDLWTLLDELPKLRSPFLRGFMPIRNTKYWLEKSDLILRDQVRVLALAFDPENSTHEGAKEFEFWHWNQLLYRNLDVQLVRHNLKPPAPFFQAFLENGQEILIDIDGHDRGQVYQRLQRVLGKTKLVMEQEKAEKETIENIANFGSRAIRQCICEVQGQHPCSQVVEAPGFLRGRWRWNKNTLT